MGKTAGARASEKRRRQRLKDEKRAGLGQGALVPGGPPAVQHRQHGVGHSGGGGGHDPATAGQKKNSKAIRRCVEFGEMDEALRVMYEGHVSPQVYSELAVGCLKAGRAGDACYVMQRAISETGGLQLATLISALTNMSQRCAPEEVMGFVRLCAPYVQLPGPPERLGYLQHFLPLMVMEYIEESRQAMEKIRTRGVSSLAAAGEALSGLRVQVDGGNGKVVTLLNDRMGPHTSACPRESSFFKGDIVYLERRSSAAHSAPAYPGDTHPGGPPCDGVTELEGEVATLIPTFTVKALGSAAAFGAWSGAYVDIFRLANRLTFTRQLAALQTLLDGQKKQGCKLQDVLCPGFGAPSAEACAAAVAGVPAACAAPPEGSIPGFLHQVAARVSSVGRHNKSQQAALQAGVTRRFTLIQGPPGAGKTTTAISLISLWLMAGRGPVLATSDSNIAVDNLLEGCAKAGMQVVRMGRPEAVRVDLNQYMLETMAQAESGGTADRSAFHQAMQRILKRAQVVCATCSGAGSEMAKACAFPTVLLDEASQATEPSSLIPLMKDAGQVALVGDHKQLPPTIVSREAETAGLNVSMFDRMVAAGVQPFMLDTQYRMHPGLACFPAKAFYQGLLKTGVKPGDRPPPAGFPWPSPHVPIAFAACDTGWEERSGSSYTNSAEAGVVMQIVQGLLAAGELGPGDIGVVTPYASQVRLLRQYLRVQRTPGVPHLEVSSVDAFQGREKEVIVFSAVRANVGGSVGFLADARRVNVMLTRAKRGLVVVGAGNTLAREPTVWGPWLKWASGCGLVAGVPAQDGSAAAALASGDFAGAAALVPDIAMTQGAAPPPAAAAAYAAAAAMPPPPTRHIAASHSAADLRTVAAATAAWEPVPYSDGAAPPPAPASSRWDAPPEPISAAAPPPPPEPAPETTPAAAPSGKPPLPPTSVVAHKAWVNEVSKPEAPIRLAIDEKLRAEKPKPQSQPQPTPEQAPQPKPQSQPQPTPEQAPQPKPEPQEEQKGAAAQSEPQPKPEGGKKGSPPKPKPKPKEEQKGAPPQPQPQGEEEGATAEPQQREAPEPKPKLEPTWALRVRCYLQRHVTSFVY
eukprot:jgi/Tetstr1/447875/TSEL_035184.t1